jgi:ribonucleoside-triphosphate reductase (formate)
MKIKKRSGEIVEFDLNKIENAIKKAWLEKEKVYTIDIAIDVETNLNGDIVEVEQVQDTVENVLREHACIDTLINYVKYRTNHADMRSIDNLVKDIYISNNKDILNENANIDGNTNSSQRDFLVSEIAKKWALECYLPKDISNAHKNGYIHYHDLGFSPLGGYINCCLVNIKDMLDNGFVMGSAQVSKPQSLRVACNIIGQIIMAVAEQNYGGTSIDRIDEILEEYVEKSYEYYLNKYKNLLSSCDLGVKLNNEALAWYDVEFEAKNAMKQLMYTINCGQQKSQVPFVTFGFGLGTSRGARLIQKAILESRIKGLGKDKRTPIFPKLCYTIKKGINAVNGDVNYDIKKLAIKCTSLRMYPDYISYEKVSEYTGNFKVCMGCRSFLSKWCDSDGNEVNASRCNMGVVSVNLPRLSLELQNTVLELRIKEYFSKLEKYVELAHRALQTRIKRLKSVKAKVAPICWVYGALARLDPDDYIINKLKDGFASISLGYVGVNEAVNGIFENTDSLISNKDKEKVAQDIIKCLSDKCSEWKNSEGYGYSLYGTPSENLANRFEKIDRKLFGKVSGVTDKEYYTNSFHLDVREKVNPLEKIDFEKPYCKWSNGGAIDYVELGNMQHNLQGLEDVIDYAMNRVMYFGVNTPVDICSCGWSGESKFNSKVGFFECPKCGTHDNNKLHVIRRICGYLGEINQRMVNAGKLDEFSKRIKHSK